MDTVHKDQIYLIQKDINLDIEECNVDGQTLLYARNPINGSPTGIGGDDKCGVYICLKLLEKIDKIKCAFFVEEEIGMLTLADVDLSSALLADKRFTVVAILFRSQCVCYGQIFC
jgi:hypothetical protein